MRIHPAEFVDLPTPFGAMRVHLFRPVGAGKYPAVVLFSEIYQMTGPIARTAAFVAGNGFLVAVPEVYHEFATPGEVFAYDQSGTDRGNLLKITKQVASYDADAVATIDYLLQLPNCNGKVATLGICLGGHLAFRAAMNANVQAGVCFYATKVIATIRLWPKSFFQWYSSCSIGALAFKRLSTASMVQPRLTARLAWEANEVVQSFHVVSPIH